MSDAKPFAEVKPETSVGDAEGYAVAVGDETLCPPWGNYSESGAEVVARTLNAAVARERREAAAEALSQLAADVRAAAGPTLVGKPSDPFWRDHFAGLAEMRAAALRKGDG